MAGNAVVGVVVQDNNQKEDKPMADQVIDLYETCLRNALIISTSFKGIIGNNLDYKQRWLQTIFLMITIGYGLPRYFFICFLYSKDEETRRSWEFYLPNYFEQLGLFGKVFHFSYIVFGSIT